VLFGVDKSKFEFESMGAALLSAIETILAEIVTDSNAELDQLPEDFHYRGRLRDQIWSDKLAYKILATIKSSYPEVASNP
jgi:hypothetical protein